MKLIIEKPTRRACPVCHKHDAKVGFIVKNSQGYTKFLCRFHLFELLRKGLDLRDTLSGEN